MIKENKSYFMYILGCVVLSGVMMVLLMSFLLSDIPVNRDCGFMKYKCMLDKGYLQYTSSPDFVININKDYTAIIKTNKGDFTIDLYEKNAPVTVNNFVFLSNEKYYNNVQFHRILKDYLIQTGDRNTLDNNLSNDGEGDPGYNFNDEINWDSLSFSNAKKQDLEKLGYQSTSGIVSVPMEQFSVVMATGGPNQNGSQFFIVTGDSSDDVIQGLNGTRTVFGKVIDGFNVIEDIEFTEVDDSSSNAPRPIEPIYITDVEIKTK